LAGDGAVKWNACGRAVGAPLNEDVGVAFVSPGGGH
jgi:hypothetical protein